MQYNTELDKLKLPEYGRNIQKMVEYCLGLADRSERQKCAETIVEVMARIFPEQASRDENHPVLWNQLAAIAEYKLDIDYPVEIVPLDELRRMPQPIDYPEGDIVYRHYGHITQELIQIACAMPNGSAKTEFVSLIARHMKNTYLAWGNSSCDPQRIINDLIALSNEEIALDIPELLDLLDDNPDKAAKAKNKVKRKK